LNLTEARDYAGQETLPQVISLADHPIVIERRQQLEALAEAERKFQGPCDTCRWHEGSSDYRLCANPLVMKGHLDPVSGKINWNKPWVHEERAEKRKIDDVEVPTICGPNGVLWEARTKEQERWSMVKQMIFPVILLLGIIYMNWKF
jgi:hypothetical protein